MKSFAAWCWLLVAVWGMPGGAQARPIPTRDLSALVWSSDAVVSARIESVQRRDYDVTAQATITRVYAGSLSDGQKLTLPFLGLYGVWGVSQPFVTTTRDGQNVAVFPSRETRDFQQGDHVIAFLSRFQRRDSPPFIATLYLVRDGKISTFYQWANPGGLRERPTGQTLGDWEKTLAQTQTRIAELKRELALPARPQDASLWLSRLRNRRAAYGSVYYDPITSALVRRVVECGDLPALEGALSLIRYNGRREIINAFNTPAGRDYLSRRVADKRASRALRLQLVRVLAQNGAMWSSSFGGAGEQGMQLLQFLAQQTQTNRQDPFLAREFVLVAQGFARRAASGRFPALQKQVESSLAGWQKVRRNAAPIVQKEIDQLNRIARSFL